MVRLWRQHRQSISDDVASISQLQASCCALAQKRNSAPGAASAFQLSFSGSTAVAVADLAR